MTQTALTAAPNCVGSTRYVTNSGESLGVSDAPAQVHWRTDLAHALVEVTDTDVDRIVVVSDPANQAATQALTALKDAGIAHMHCTLTTQCDADAFMDEEDAEAVAERLRQLGYL